MTRLVLVGLAALAAASAAFGAQAASPAPAAASADKCFLTRDLRNHTVGDDHTLYFNVNGRDTYQVTTSGNCLSAVTSSDPIVMNNTGSMGRICNKMDWDIKVRGMRCIVSDVKRLTPEEAKALPKRLRP